jgi:hypothetical protein
MYISRDMAVKFELTPKAYSCILGKRSIFSSAYACFIRAESRNQTIEGIEVLHFEVTCGKPEVIRLLSIAKEHCPDAAPAIEESISRSESGS